MVNSKTVPVNAYKSCDSYAGGRKSDREILIFSSCHRNFTLFVHVN